MLIQSSVIQSVAQHTVLELNLGSSQHATLIFQKIVRMKLQSTLNSFQQLEDRELTVDEITHAKATLTTQRNDERINSQNRVMLQHWRANVLFKPLLTLTSVSGTWRSMQQKLNLDNSQHLKCSVCVNRLNNTNMASSALQTDIIQICWRT